MVKCLVTFGFPRLIYHWRHICITWKTFHIPCHCENVCFILHFDFTSEAAGVRVTDTFLHFTLDSSVKSIRWRKRHSTRRKTSTGLRRRSTSSSSRSARSVIEFIFVNLSKLGFSGGALRVKQCCGPYWVSLSIQSLHSTQLQSHSQISTLLHISALRHFHIQAFPHSAISN